MRIITNSKLAERNINIGKWASYAGIALLVGALFANLYALFGRPNDFQLVVVVFALFIVGYLLSNVGMFMNNRWARRADKGLADALRGTEKYTLYNYRFGASHVLVGPSGVYVLHPKYQSGPIEYTNGKWLHPGAPPRRLFNFFAPREVLGSPDIEAESEVEALNKFLKKNAPEAAVEPKPVVVFMHPRAVLSAKDAPVTTLHVKQLKDYVRRQVKGPTLPESTLSELEEKLGIKE